VKFTSALFTAGFVLASTPAFAAEPPVVRGFTDLPSTGTLRVYGSANINVDPFHIAHGAMTGGTGVPFTDPFTFDLPTRFTLLASLETEFELPDEDDPTEFEEVGEFEDAVFLDTTDGRMVFGSRIEMDLDEEGEINDIFRFGFEGFDVAVAWTFVTSDDLRLFSAAHSGVSNIANADVFDPNVVGLASDINVEEGQPTSGWFFIKVLNDNVGYAIFENAVGLKQAGEEDQLPFTARLDGFAPVAVPVAVPGRQSMRRSSTIDGDRLAFR